MARPAKGYKLPNGTKAIGVTTVLNRWKESGGLIYWACTQGQAYPDLSVNEALYGVQDKATDIGTCVHNMVETHIKGGKPKSVLELAGFTDEGKQKAQSGFDAYLSWERMTKLKITHQELPLVCPEYGFAGTPDAIGIIEGNPCLLDWKTSNAVYSDMLIQLAAYGHLVQYGLLLEQDYKPLGIKVQGFHLCRFSKEYGDFSHHYYPQLDLEWEQFKLFLQCYENDKLIKKRAA